MSMSSSRCGVSPKVLVLACCCRSRSEVRDTPYPSTRRPRNVSVLSHSDPGTRKRHVFLSRRSVRSRTCPCTHHAPCGRSRDRRPRLYDFCTPLRPDAPCIRPACGHGGDRVPCATCGQPAPRAAPATSSSSPPHLTVLPSVSYAHLASHPCPSLSPRPRPNPTLLTPPQAWSPARGWSPAARAAPFARAWSPGVRTW